MSSLSSALGTGPSRNCGAGAAGAKGPTGAAGPSGVKPGEVGVSSVVAVHSGNRLGDDVAVWNVSSVFRVEFGEANGSKLRLKLERKHKYIYFFLFGRR